MGDAGKGSGGAAAGKAAEGVLAPLLPMPCRCGRPRRWPLREVVNAIFYVLRCSCPWRLLPPVGFPPALPVEPCRPPPKDLPPWRTAYRWFARLRDEGIWEALNFALVMADRERSGRSATLRWLSIGSADGTFASSARVRR
jgi:transposase